VAAAPLLAPHSVTHGAAALLQVYTRELGRLVLPVADKVFQDAEMVARRTALHSFDSQLLGRSQGAALSEQLNKAMARERDIKATANVAQSNMVCQVCARWAQGRACCRQACALPCAALIPVAGCAGMHHPGSWNMAG
jgi:hypothetical protein